MKTFIIHFTRSSGSDDSFKISGETTEECRELARQEIKNRGLEWVKACIWSEEI